MTIRKGDPRYGAEVGAIVGNSKCIGEAFIGYGADGARSSPHDSPEQAATYGWKKTIRVTAWKTVAWPPFVIDDEIGPDGEVRARTTRGDKLIELHRDGNLLVMQPTIVPSGLIREMRRRVREAQRKPT